MGSLYPRYFSVMISVDCSGSSSARLVTPAVSTLSAQNSSIPAGSEAAISAMAEVKHK